MGLLTCVAWTPLGPWWDNIYDGASFELGVLLWWDVSFQFGFLSQEECLYCIQETAKDFMLSGTAPESLYGMCESMWRPEMGPEELFETLAQCLLSGVDRDALAGWGSIVHVITKDKVFSRTLKGRMDWRYTIVLHLGDFPVLYSTIRRISQKEVPFSGVGMQKMIIRLFYWDLSSSWTPRAVHFV
jgi:hypothetical protein